MSFSSSNRIDINNIYRCDPAHNIFEIFIAYPGFHARQFDRLAHALFHCYTRFFLRLVSHIVRFFTGKEIHPGGRLGKQRSLTVEPELSQEQQ